MTIYFVYLKGLTINKADMKKSIIILSVLAVLSFIAGIVCIVNHTLLYGFTVVFFAVTFLCGFVANVLRRDYKPFRVGKI